MSFRFRLEQNSSTLAHVEFLLDLLRRHPDPDTRRKAADEIVRSAGPEALDILVPLLSDPDRSVRDVAGRVILKLGTHASAEQVSRLLLTNDCEIQRFIRDLLYRMGPEVLPYVLPYLSHENATIRKSAVDTVAMLRPAGCAESLLPLLQDDHPDVVLSTIEALGNIGDESAVPDLIRIFESEEYARNDIAAALGSIGGADATRFLCASFNRILIQPDPDTMTLIEIISALGSIGDPAAFDLLGEHVQHAEGRTRHAMIGAMLWIAERSGMPLSLLWASQEDLLQLLDDPDLRIRIRVVEELANNSDDKVTRALVRSLGSSDYFDVVLLGVLETRSSVAQVIEELLSDLTCPAKNILLLLRMALQPHNPTAQKVRRLCGPIADLVRRRWLVENDQCQKMMMEVLFMLDPAVARDVMEQILHSVSVDDHEGRRLPISLARGAGSGKNIDERSGIVPTL